VERAAYDVAVVCWNHAGTLPACLAAVSSLVPGPERVMLLDNGSTDGSAEVARSWRDRLPLEIVASPTNLGFAGGVNRVWSRGRAPWLLLLNPDCAPRPDHAAALLEAVDRRPEAVEVGSVTGKLLRAADETLAETPVVDAAGMVVTPSGRHFDRGSGQSDDGRWDRPAWVFGGTGACTLHRRAALEDVLYPDGQLLPESFFAYREDAELAWRLQWRGWRCLYAPAAVAAHARGLRPERGRRQDPAVNRISVQNRFLLRLHCADRGWLLRCFPWWFLRDLLVIGACLTVERSSLPGLVGAWRERPDARRRRRWVLGRARVPSRRLSRWFRRGGWTEPLEGV